MDQPATSRTRPSFNAVDTVYVPSARSDAWAFANASSSSYGSCGDETVTVTDADLPPAVAVMVAVPAFEPAVTTPVPITLATLESELVHVTFRSVTFDGLTVAVSCTLAPDFRLSFPLRTPSPETDTDVTGTGASATATTTEAVLPTAVAVIVAVPAFTAVILPSDTLATELFELVQETVLSVAFDGVTVAVNCTLAPDFRLSLPSLTPEPEIETEETGTGCGVLQFTALTAAEEPSQLTLPENSMPGWLAPGVCAPEPLVKITRYLPSPRSGTSYL